MGITYRRWWIADHEVAAMRLWLRDCCADEEEADRVAELSPCEVVRYVALNRWGGLHAWAMES